MKKFSILCIALVSLLFVATSCGSSTPSDVTVKAVTAMQTGDMKTYISLLDATQAQKDKFASMFEEKGESYLAEMEKSVGKFDHVEILSETIAEDGNSAVVKFEIFYSKDGHSKKDKLKLTLVDGKWLVKDPTANK